MKKGREEGKEGGRNEGRREGKEENMESLHLILAKMLTMIKNRLC
jgi:flagellar biosynthesis/type III secretory pathway protein FliH